MVKKAKSGGSAGRLKVFGTHIGLKDWVVAVSSRKAALEAWDVSANLFATGAAWEVTDPEAITAAMKNPGNPVAIAPKRPPKHVRAQERAKKSAEIVKFEPKKKSKR